MLDNSAGASVLLCAHAHAHAQKKKKNNLKRDDWIGWMDP